MQTVFHAYHSLLLGSGNKYLERGMKIICSSIFQMAVSMQSINANYQRRNQLLRLNVLNRINKTLTWDQN